MREYELSVIYDLALAEANGAEAGVERLTRLVETHGGAMKSVDHWGRRRMAYPINKAIDGDYVVTRIEVDPAAVAPIEAALRIDENVYRSLVVRADELYEIAPIQERPPREPREPRPEAPAALAETPAAPQPVAETPVPETAAQETAVADDTPEAAVEAPAVEAGDEPAAEAQAEPEAPEEPQAPEEPKAEE